LQVSTTSEYTVADQQRMSKAVRYFEWQSRISAEALGRRVLEVGCGLGNFTQSLVERELVVGIDIDAACIELHHQRFRERPNVQSRVLDALDPEFLELKQHRPDSIACLNVLEHISDDLATLKRFADVLPTGGRVVLLVPAFKALYGPIDANLGHYRRYTKASLRATAEQAGLRAHTLKFMNLVGFFGWWVNAKVLKREEQSEGQIALFDGVIVPVMSTLEGWVEPPVGQSIFAVLEKV
jgi:SAM-dependent methyltransferase